MAKPMMRTIDDDRGVLRAVERDLRRQYGNRYRLGRGISRKGAGDLPERPIYVSQPNAVTKLIEDATKAARKGTS